MITLFIQETKKGKVSEYTEYFDTYKEAKSLYEEYKKSSFKHNEEITNKDSLVLLNHNGKPSLDSQIVVFNF